MQPNDEDAIEGELIEVSTNALAALNSSEIDTQISTAKRYPRSLKQFRHEALEMATLDEETAGECMYALPRAGKTIQGPSARLAEIIASAWGNCRAGARIVGEDDKFVTAQGVFIDLQKNVAITYEVRRRITNKYGKKFDDDMIGVTSNAACSIALRNAVFKGVPKALWRSVYEAARKTAIGDASTLAAKRLQAVQAFGKMGVTEQMVLDLLDVAGVEDITLDGLAVLRGLYTAIKDGDTTIDQAFQPQTGSTGAKARRSDLEARLTAPPVKPPATPPAPETATREPETAPPADDAPSNPDEPTLEDLIASGQLTRGIKETLLPEEEGDSYYGKGG